MERRQFLKSAVVGGFARKTFAADNELAQRPYRDDVRLSIIGFGGLVVVGLEQPEADRTVAESIDRGVNYFDVAPTYGDGEAEQKLGPALRPYRNRVFLACKTTERTAAGATRELEQSLKRLMTDHFDLYQFHAVSSLKDIDQILAPGGAAETFLAARKQGKVRYIGCSAHSGEAAIALMDSLPLDSILFPVNFVCWARGNFGPQIMAKAREKGIARLALKALAYTPWPDAATRRGSKYAKSWYRPIDDPQLAAEALRFTLSEDVTAAIPPGNKELFNMAVNIASGFKPMRATEREKLLAATAGKTPLFKA